MSEWGFAQTLCERLLAADAGEWPEALKFAADLGYVYLSPSMVEPGGTYYLNPERVDVPVIKVRFSEDVGGICILEAKPMIGTTSNAKAYL